MQPIADKQLDKLKITTVLDSLLINFISNTTGLGGGEKKKYFHLTVPSNFQDINF
jgi:hypothetical protein